MTQNEQFVNNKSKINDIQYITELGRQLVVRPYVRDLTLFVYNELSQVIIIDRLRVELYKSDLGERTVFYNGADTEKVNESHIQGVVNRCLKDKDVLILSDVMAECESDGVNLPVDYPFASEIYMPLLYGKDASVIGSVSFHSKVKNSYGAKHRVFATLISNYVAIAIRSIAKRNTLETKNNELNVVNKAINQATISSITDLKGDLLYVNNKFCERSQYSREDLLGKNQSIVNSGYHSKDFWKDMWRVIGNGNTWRGVIRNQTKNGEYYWVDTVIVPFMNSKGKPEKYLSLRFEITQRMEYEQLLEISNNDLLEKQERLNEVNHEISLAFEEVEKSKNKITASINYAQRIQKALLPSKELLNKQIGAENYFIYYGPKDIVSGDFYWLASLGSDEHILVVADCTGHGVPGALMSAIGITLLDKIVNHQKITQPNLVLDALHKQLEDTLLRTHENESVKDGMEMAIVKTSKNNVTFAGANMPIYLADENSVSRIRTDRMPIGGGQYRKRQPYQLFELDIKTPSFLYMTSDGYADQFGGMEDRKFSTKNLKKVIGKVWHLPVHEQSDFFDFTFKQWKGDKKQIDDVSVLGISIG